VKHLWAVAFVALGCCVTGRAQTGISRTNDYREVVRVLKQLEQVGSTPIAKATPTR
jgi:hypothetical protein